MSYVDDKSFSSVFGDAADDIEFDKVLEADEENDLIEAVMSLSENDDDFHETTGENDKDPDDIEEELEGRPDSGDNSHTNALDIDLAAEMAMYESQLYEADADLAETTGENDKTPKDIERELEGRSDDGSNRHTGTFDSRKGSNTSLGNYRSAERDLDDLDGATDRAASQGEDLYTDGDLSTEAWMCMVEADGDLEGPEPGYEGDDYDGQDDYDGNEDYEGQDDYDGDEDFDGVAEVSYDDDYEDYDDLDDFDDEDLDDLEESSTDDPDVDDDLIDAADEEDGEMTQAEIEALVAAGGDDDLLDEI